MSHKNLCRLCDVQRQGDGWGFNAHDGATALPLVSLTYGTGGLG